MKKSFFMKGLAFTIIGCIIISSLLVFFNFYIKVEPSEIEEPKKVIDNRISPLTTQAIFFEINRIRVKGIIKHMYESGFNIFDIYPKVEKSEIPIILDGLRPGIGWRKNPTFSYSISIQNNSRGSYCDFVGKVIYKTWDTDYINNEIFTSVNEEQIYSEVVFTFQEIKEKLLGETRINKESFNIIYDFRNGTWTGVDFFNDSDGYGHYNGTFFEMWFDIKQTDYDGDGIPWWTEVNILSTDPEFDDSKFDPDFDGIPTSWEWKWGYPPLIWNNHTSLDPDNDGLQNIEEYYMEKWLANPFHPDIYIEVDYMDNAPFKPWKNTRLDGSEHVFWEESQQMLMERFCEHSITVHIDDGIIGGGGEILSFESFPGMYNQEQGVISEYYKNNFNDERKGIFRYLFIAHGGGWCYPQDSKHYYDCMCVPSVNIFYRNQLDLALSPRAKRIGRAVSVMHELGHSCGFNKVEHTPGVDNYTLDWSDYMSVMNYHYFRQRYFDYSDGTNGVKDTNDWKLIDIGFFQRTSERMEGVCP